MILEGIVTTVNADGGTNVAPMGPLVDSAMTRLCLRPYQSSLTYGNLKRTGQGVFHVTDDVLLIAQTAIGDPDPPPGVRDATAVNGRILIDACRWYAFRVDRLDDRQPRAEIECRIVDRGRLRDFFGFNRAKHAVIEAAVLATRTGLLPPEEIQRGFEPLSALVEKTGGPQERRAFSLLESYVAQKFDP